MQAVLLAAGLSSRFFPFNDRHKCLIKIAGEPIIVHTIRSVKRAGINDIIMVVGNNQDFQDTLGNGKKYGVKIRYVTQSSAEGMGDALLCASKYIDSDFFLINSNHIEFESLKLAIDKKRKTNRDAILVAKEEKGEHFGVLKVDGDRVTQLVEKPKDRTGLSSLRVVGVYFLNQDFLQILKKEKKDHYNFESALNNYAKEGHLLVAITDAEIATLKYPWHILNIKKMIMGRLKKSISKKATISKFAQISGNVVVEDGAVISENAVIKGPVYIGRNVFVGTNALIRDGSDIEEGAKIGSFVEIKNSLIGEGSTTHTGLVEDSVIGSNTKIGAGVNTANTRLDRISVKAFVRNEKIDTGFRHLGMILGSNCAFGTNVSTMPGVVIGNNVNVGPSTTIMHNVDSDTTYFTKFSEVITKNKPKS